MRRHQLNQTLSTLTSVKPNIDLVEPDIHTLMHRPVRGATYPVAVNIGDAICNKVRFSTKPTPLPLVRAGDGGGGLTEECHAR